MPENAKSSDALTGGPTAGQANDPAFSAHFPIIGIGASAGGLEALEKFFFRLDSLSGLSIVVVTHLDPHHKSLMAELLSDKTQLAVYQAEEGQELEPDSVYIIPPNRDLIIREGKLRLLEPNLTHGVRHPIDIFFRSLAQERREEAICIVLSGTGSDGTLGLKEIKGAGGMVMVQDADSAKYDGMPRSALATGMADFVLPVEEMPQILHEYIKRAHDIRAPEASPEDVKSPDAVDNILTLVRHRLGHDFTHYKRSTIARRIEKRMLIQNLDSFGGYYQMLDKNNAEVEALFNDMLIGVTSFFRDPEAFHFLENDLIPKLFEDKKADDSVRIWVPGCSTGEEAYTLAILLKEHMDSIKRSYDVQIFATDIDKRAVESARAGCYPESISCDVSPERLKRFFRIKDERYCLLQSIREMVVFAPHDILRDPPFFKLDMVSCRNLLIYMNAEIQKKILPLFYYSLNPGGYLLLGSSETVGQFKELFNARDKKWKIYQRSLATTKAPVDFPLSPRRLVSYAKETEHPLAYGRISPSEVLERQLLRRYAPPSVLIDEKLNILYYFGDTSPFFSNPEGQPTENIIKKVRQDLRLRLRTSIQRAVKTGQSVCLSDLVFPDDNNSGYAIHVEPVSEPVQAQGVLLVIFEPQNAVNGTAELLHISPDQQAMVVHLEEELKLTGEELQDTIEELESANEELKSSNEELMSMNEELQSSNEEMETSKEELQAMNEELTTVNAELNSKVDELQSAYSDIENLLASSNVATVFVDKKMIIRRFTPQAQDIFHIIKSDIGRPLQHVVSKLSYTGLADDCRAVLKDLSWRESEVRSEDGNHFLMRLVPYRTVEDAIDGVVLTFVDITQLKAFEQEMRISRERLALALDATGAGVYDHAVLEKSYYHAEQWAHILGYRTDELPPYEGFKEWFADHIHPDDRDWEKEAYQSFVSGESGHYDVECRMRCKDGRFIWVRCVSKAVNRDADGRATRIVGLMMDVTGKKQVELELERRVEERTRELKERELMLTAILQSYPGGAINVLDRDLRYIFAQGRGLEELGLSPEALVGKTHDALYDAGYLSQVRPYYQRAFDGETVEFDLEHAQKWYHLTASPMEREAQPAAFILVIVRDITERKQSEAQIASLARFPNENPYPVLRVSASGEIIYANPSSQELLDCWDRCIGQTLPDDISALVSKSYVSGTIAHAELPVGPATFHMSFTPLVDKGYVNIYCLDITDRKRAETQLKESEDRFRSVVENINEGFWIRTFPDNKVIYTSPYCDSLFGFPAGTIRNHTDQIIEAIDTADQERIRDAMSRLYGQGESFDESYWITGRDERRRFLKVQGIPLVDEHGRIYRMIGMAIDLTESKLLEEAYKLASEEARKANKTKSEFLANMSHEIRTPLNGLMGMLQLLEASPLAAEQQEFIDYALQSSRRLNRLLADILDLSRVEAGKLQLIPEIFDFTDTMDGILQLFKPAARKKGLEFQVHINPAIPSRLVGDAARLQQVFNNLVGNAIKFTSAGCIEIDAHPLPATRPDTYRVLFSVTDTGIGISEEILKRLFTPFTQAEESYTRRFQGAGLGLAICKRLVTLMGGNIAVESEEGSGSSFHFCITFAVPEENDPAVLESESVVLPQNLRVLLAEDDKVSQHVVVKLMQKLGHRIDAVEDGRRALKKLRSSRYDLLLMDVQMPVLDGVDATLAIRRGEAGSKNQRIPIIAMTAYAMAGEKEAFIRAGMDGYLAKPIEHRELEKELARVLGEKSQQAR